MKRAEVNMTLTVFLLASVVPYSSEVQQPMRATAIVGRHPHARCAAPLDREQGRADSLHPAGLTARDRREARAANLPQWTITRQEDEQGFYGYKRCIRCISYYWHLGSFKRV